VKEQVTKSKPKAIRKEYDFSHGVRGKYAAVSNLDQLIEEARGAVRKGKLRDWPRREKRLHRKAIKRKR
jgi:hypothetical protein